MSAIELLRWASETTLAIALMIAIILIIRKPIARLFGASVAFALWAAPAIRLFVPELKILPAQSSQQIAAYALSSDPLLVSAAATALDNNPLSSWSLISAPEPPIALGVFAAAVLLVWVMGAIAWLHYCLEKQARYTKNLHAASTPAAPELRRLAKDIAEDFSVRQSFEVRLCNEQFGPMVAGFLRPKIYLPSNFLSDYTTDEKRYAIAHEISHIKRGDLFFAFAALLFQAAQWPNPLVHVAHRAFREDQEAACDAFVMNAKRNPSDVGAYASAIVKAARHSVKLPAYGLSLNHPVKERLMLLKTNKMTFSRKLTGCGAVGALIISAQAVTADYGYAAYQDKKEETAQEVEKENLFITENEDGKTIKKRVIIMKNGDEKDVRLYGVEESEIEIFEGDGDVIHFVKKGNSPEGDYHGSCSGENNVKLEWKEESDEGDGEIISQSIICIAGDDANLENNIPTLREAIKKMEENAKKEETRRKRMIEGLKKQLRELEKKNK